MNLRSMGEKSGSMSNSRLHLISKLQLLDKIEVISSMVNNIALGCVDGKDPTPEVEDYHEWEYKDERLKMDLRNLVERLIEIGRKGDIPAKLTGEKVHEIRMDLMNEEGWTYSPTFDLETKTHPWIQSYSALNASIQVYYTTLASVFVVVNRFEPSLIERMSLSLFTVTYGLAPSG